MKKTRPYKYRLFQDGFCVASVESADREQAEKEIRHYAMIYSQDGPVEIRPKLKESGEKK